MDDFDTLAGRVNFLRSVVWLLHDAPAGGDIAVSVRWLIDGDGNWTDGEGEDYLARAKRHIKERRAREILRCEHDWFLENKEPEIYRCRRCSTVGQMVGRRAEVSKATT